MNNGFDVTCLDISSKLISCAQKRNPGACFVQEDFLTAQFYSSFDGVFTFAFIHLFPKKVAHDVLKKIQNILKVGGVAYIGSTKSTDSTEGWEVKKDYGEEHTRYRKHWTEVELRETLADFGFETVDFKEYIDPFGKIWMDFIVRKI